MHAMVCTRSQHVYYTHSTPLLTPYVAQSTHCDAFKQLVERFVELEPDGNFQVGRKACHRCSPSAYLDWHPSPGRAASCCAPCAWHASLGVGPKHCAST